jgi:hypothetical protein
MDTSDTSVTVVAKFFDAAGNLTTIYDDKEIEWSWMEGNPNYNFLTLSHNNGRSCTISIAEEVENNWLKSNFYIL